MESIRIITRNLTLEVCIETNLTAQEMEELFEEYSQRHSLEEHDCFMAIVIGQGDANGYIIGSDGEKVRVQAMLQIFNSMNCPGLEGKPKLLFIQTCREPGFDHNVRSRKYPDNLFKSDQQQVPTLSNVCVCYFGNDPFVPIRDEKAGSLKLRTLATTFAKHGQKLELHAIFTLTNGILMDLRPLIYGNQVSGLDIEYRGWTKPFYFDPKHEI
jgi:caspase 7